VNVHWGWDIDDVVDVCCTAGNEELGDEGAIRIAEGLEKNTSLTSFDLRGVFPLHLLLDRSLFHLLRVSCLM